MMTVTRMMTITTPSTAELSSADQSSSGRETGALSVYRDAVRRYSHINSSCFCFVMRRNDSDDHGYAFQQMLDVCGTSLVLPGRLVLGALL